MGKIMLNEISYSGGGGNADIVRLTQAEYDALPSSKLTDDKIYMIEDGASGEVLFDIKKITWVGTGELTNSITFNEVPDVILNIYGSGINNTHVNCETVLYGSTFLPARFYEGSNRGNLYIPVTYSNDNKTITLTFSDEGGAFNVLNETYSLYYLKMKTSQGGN